MQFNVMHRSLTSTTVHTCALSKMSQYYIVTSYLSVNWFQGIEYVHRQETIDTTVPLKHSETVKSGAVSQPMIDNKRTQQTNLILPSDFFKYRAETRQCCHV